MPTVVLDAGHGGHDPGAVNGTRLEKNDNLKMALAVGGLLKNCGVNVIYTRDKDVFISLGQRSRISNNARADLFVSFHRNASTNENAAGVENWVFVSPSARAVAAADNVIKRIAAVGVQGSRGVKYGNYSVLRETIAPAMLIELGFISNRQDNALFDSNFYGYANATANGILNSLGIDCHGFDTQPKPPSYPGGGYSDIIRNIQSTLNSRYNAGLVADGRWGPKSNRELIRAYQIELNDNYNAGLVEDGIWGYRTRAATRNLRQGSRGNLVWILQAALYENGYGTTPDGVFGAQTDIAVRNFQRANGLTADGVAGANTFERLFEL